MHRDTSHPQTISIAQVRPGLSWQALLGAALLAFLVLLPSSSHAVQTFNTGLPWINRDVWLPALDSVWHGIKERNIEPWSTGLIHRPKSESPGDAVSEGLGYGMILALYANDQAAFDSLWDAGDKYIWSNASGYYNWRANSSGNVIGTGAATDAEEDIAAMLIFADRLAEAGIWTAGHTTSNGVTYAQRAQVMLNSIWTKMVANSRYLAPGAGWGGSDFVNPGYFAPAFYKVFDRFDTASTHNWTQLIDQCYTTLEANPGAALGLGPDWMTPYGSFYNGSLGYNPFDGGHSMYKDAIRILWRLSTDALWFQDTRAQAFLSKSIQFLDSIGGAPKANFFDMQGNTVSCDSQFVFNGGALSRSRCEHSHLTIAMWSTAAMAVGDDSLRLSFHKEMLKYYTPGNKYFGKATDANNEDTLHNEMYFDQFLAWFGTSIMAGVYSDVVAALDNPPAAIIANPGVRSQASRYRLVASTENGLLAVQNNVRRFDLSGRSLRPFH